MNIKWLHLKTQYQWFTFLIFHNFSFHSGLLGRVGGLSHRKQREKNCFFEQKKMFFFSYAPATDDFFIWFRVELFTCLDFGFPKWKLLGFPHDQNVLGALYSVNFQVNASYNNCNFSNNSLLHSLSLRSLLYDEHNMTLFPQTKKKIQAEQKKRKEKWRESKLLLWQFFCSDSLSNNRNFCFFLLFLSGLDRSLNIVPSCIKQVQVPNNSVF